MSAAYGLFIGGEWVPALDGGTYHSPNPYTGEPWAEVPDATTQDVDRAVRAADHAFRTTWLHTSGFERARLMRRLADLLERDAEQLARLETNDNGKLLRETRGQMHSLPAWLRYFAGLADKIEGSSIPADKSNYFIYTRREPVGVVGAIVPWNSPLALLMWKLAPGLAAGCTFVIKPSDQTPVTALAFAQRVEEAGFPPGVINIVTARAPEIGAALVQHPLVRKVAFTGSTATGIRIVRDTAENLPRVTLELGGKSAQLVFDDCDVPGAVNGIVAGIFAASGQTCIAGSRLLVHTSIHREVVERLTERAANIVLGDPLDAATQMGPLANQQQYEMTLGFIDRAQAQGGRIVCGGADGERGGLFVHPTIVDGVRPDMELANEEVFGPVLAVMPFDDEEEAIQLANGTSYGLAAGLWTTNVHRAHRVAHQLRAGTVWINCYRVVAPNAPFGGMGMSGWGRESGIEAVDDYLETKTIWLELDGVARDPFTMG